MNPFAIKNVKLLAGLFIHRPLQVIVNCNFRLSISVFIRKGSLTPYIKYH